MADDLWQAGQAVDLDNCAHEPIHIPGSIQPLGSLLAVSEPDLRVMHYSINAAEMLGWPTEQLGGKTLFELFPPATRAGLHTLTKNPSDAELAENNPLKFTFSVGGRSREFDGVVHRTRQGLILELEPSGRQSAISFLSLHQQVSRALRSMQASPSLLELCQNAAREVRELVGYDRVMIYQFDPEWNGRVVAEARAEDTKPFLGLHFPASDIPAQARALYEHSLIRVIGDVHYQPVPIQASPTAGKTPLDLSHSLLRSVSPIHLEYLRNMKVGASMSISILREGRLWGLIACHHRAARPISYETRVACEFIGQFMSSQLIAKEKREDLNYRAKLKALQPEFFRRISAQKETDFLEPLLHQSPDIRELTSAAGAAILYHGECTLIGQTPSEEEILELARWLTKSGKPEVFSTDSLARKFPAEETYKDTASGLIALSIPEPGDHYLFWFRPEVIQTVHWSGDPNKSVEVSAIPGEAPRLHPRKSFELWKEVVGLRSDPWKPVEIEAVEELRRSVIDVDLARQVLREHAARTEAERSNAELDEFAYVVSHDLKEPLRGIKHYAQFIMEDERDRLTEAGRANVDEIHLLAQRTQALLTSLHYHSKIGRIQLAYGPTDLNQVITEVCDLLKLQIKETHTEIKVPLALPLVHCDQARIGEVFNNLFTNAMKYNVLAHKTIIVRCDISQNPPVFRVEDNGIGIPETQRETVFGIFKRLHGDQEYGGGSGAGLAIARKIVERHGGRIWIESTPVQGSAFCFTLAGPGKISRDARA